MKSPIRLIFAVCLTAFVLAGCAPQKYSLRSIKSVGVDKIPSNLGIYPLLSANIDRFTEGYNAPLGSAEPVRNHGNLLSLSFSGKNVVISPPADTQMLITTDSQMMAEMLSVSLSAVGFKLKQLPVQMKESEKEKSKDAGKVFISMDVLDELRTKYGIESILLGTVIFVRDINSGTKKVSFLHLKVVDTKTLDVLAQFTTPQLDNGAETGQVVDDMASSMAELAGLGTKP